jgi:hypothetical protein
MSLRVPNSPRFAFAARNASHLKPVSATSTSRSSQPARPRGGADFIASLLRLQRLLAMDDVDRRQRAREMGREVLEAQFHGRT